MAVLQCLVFSFLFLSIVSPHIESAPTRPNETYYHTVGVDTFKFRFPSAKSRLNYAEKMAESLVSKGINGRGGIKLALHHDIHPSMMNSTDSAKWMRHIALHSLKRDKYRTHAIITANSTHNNQLRANASVSLLSGYRYGANFIVNVGIGTPSRKEIKMNFDTANDVSWLQCHDIKRSSSYERLTCSNSCNREVTGVSCNHKLNRCNYWIQFDTGGQLKARMSKDTLWLGSRPTHEFTFGCVYNYRGSNSDPSIGLLALSRNSLSMPSQTASQYKGKFSYCLPNYLNPPDTGSLRLGPGSIPSRSKFTPLLSNPWAKSWYFVGLKGISVGSRRLKISPDVFKFHSGGRGGTIIDSGVMFSRLVKPAYDALRAAFVKNTGLPLTKPQPENPFDTCFNFSSIKTLRVPSIMFHFQNGMRLRIHKEGILTPVSQTVSCLAFQRARMNDLSIVGTLQQQRYIVSFDKHRKQVGFASVRSCTHTVL